MKKVLGKNQIIISALAIMIAIAGYLNFTKDKANDFTNIDDHLNTVQNVDDTSVLDYGSDIGDEYADISDEDEMNFGNMLTLNDNGELVLKENNASKEEDATGTEDSTDASNNTSTPGEAVLASTTLESGFFSNAKLAREQMRSKSKQTLMEIVADTTVTDDQKQAAIDCVIQMTEIAEMENAAELLLEAKGFSGVVVNIVDGNVDVVVNAEYITDAQIAQIEDIVIRKTNSAPDQIVITSVVVEE